MTYNPNERRLPDSLLIAAGVAAWCKDGSMVDLYTLVRVARDAGCLDPELAAGKAFEELLATGRLEVRIGT